MNTKDTDITKIIRLTNFNIESYIPTEQDSNGMLYLNLMRAIKIPQDINPIFYDLYVPTEKESFQTISYKKYGTIKLWWLICATNFIFDTTNGAMIGIPLKIIKEAYIQTILNQLSSTI